MEQKYAAHWLAYVVVAMLGRAPSDCVMQQPATNGESTVNTAEISDADAAAFAAGLANEKCHSLYRTEPFEPESVAAQFRVGCGIGANTTRRDQVVSQPKSPSARWDQRRGQNQLQHGCRTRVGAICRFGLKTLVRSKTRTTRLTDDHDSDT